MYRIILVTIFENNSSNKCLKHQFIGTQQMTQMTRAEFKNNEKNLFLTNKKNNYTN